MADRTWIEDAKEQHEEQRVRNSFDLFTLPRAIMDVSELSYLDGTNAPKTLTTPNVVRTNRAGVYVRKAGVHYLIPWHRITEVKVVAPVVPTP